LITENLSTLKIHKLTQAQYDRELAAGNIDETAIYLTPDRSITVWQPNTKYKVGDVCYWDSLANNYSGYSVFLECKLDHTSGGYSDPLPDLSNWTVLEITADRSIHDAWGKVIHETYATKEEVDNYLGGLSGGITRIIVDTLPTNSSEINENAIYMIPSQNGTENNIYDEYMFFDGNGGFLVPEIIGSTAVDLSDYYTKAEVDNITKNFIHSDTLASDYYNAIYIDQVVNDAGSRINNIENAIGDIDSVLDELHNYAQTLITEGVEQ
jgi:hypothetical protein